MLFTYTLFTVHYLRRLIWWWLTCLYSGNLIDLTFELNFSCFIDVINFISNFLCLLMNLKNVCGCYWYAFRWITFTQIQTRSPLELNFVILMNSSPYWFKLYSNFTTECYFLFRTFVRQISWNRSLCSNNQTYNNNLS